MKIKIKKSLYRWYIIDKNGKKKLRRKKKSLYRLYIIDKHGKNKLRKYKKKKSRHMSNPENAKLHNLI